jgi:TonB family protein
MKSATVATAEAAEGLQGPLAAPIRLAGDHPRLSRGLRLAAFLAALAAHAATLFLLMREPAGPMAGSYGHLLDAVNVTLVNSAVLESRQAERVPPAPAAADSVQAKEGTAESATPRPEQKEKTAEEKQPHHAPMAADAPDKAPAKVQKSQQEQEKEPKEASAAAVVGGVTSRGDSVVSVEKSAPAAASPGAVREYWRLVSQALAKTRPKGVGHWRVKIGLVISTEGQLVSVEVAKSSGNKAMDDIAVSAVRRARFPRPPPGMTSDQLWYEIDFFR